MIFDFKCSFCGRIEPDVFMKFDHEKMDHPVCCIVPMEKCHLRAPAIHWRDYDLPDGGFKTGKEGTVITTRKQNREYMEQHNLIDANEAYDIPTHAEEARANAEAAESIEAITPTAEQFKQLKDDGFLV